MLGTNVTFAVIGTSFWFVLNTKELPKKYGFIYTYNSWDWWYFFRLVGLLLCLEYVGFYFTGTLIFSYSYYVTTDGVSVYENESEFITVCLVCGLAFVIMALFAKQAVWTTVVGTVIFTIIMHVLFTCNAGEKPCFVLKIIVTAFVCLVFAVLFNGIAEKIGSWIFVLAIHMTVSFTAVQSVAICAKDFEYWQLEQNYWWIPLVCSTVLAIIRFTVEYAIMHTTCCGMDGVSRQFKKLAGDIDGKDLDDRRDRYEEELRRAREEIEAATDKYEAAQKKIKTRKLEKKLRVHGGPIGLANLSDEEEDGFIPVGMEASDL